jgi:formiminotetrahydrofolate cyclodeaminase
MREHEMQQVKDKLAEAEGMRSQFATLRKEKEQEREEMKRRQLENNQLKEQLNRKVAESNKIFEDLHRVETDFKTYKANTTQL